MSASQTLMTQPRMTRALIAAMFSNQPMALCDVCREGYHCAPQDACHGPELKANLEVLVAEGELGSCSLQRRTYYFRTSSPQGEMCPTG